MRASVPPIPSEPLADTTPVTTEPQRGFWSPSQRNNLLTFGLFMATSLAAYGALLSGGLKMDDINWFEMTRARGALATDYVGLHFWRPTVSIVFWAVWKCFGIWPAAFRLLNVFLTSMTAYAIRSIWLRVCPEPKTALWSSIILGLAFILWPTHAETVAWIAGLTDGLAIALGTSALWCYIIYRQDGKSRYLVLCVVLLAAALTSKESAVPFPLLCFGFAFVLVPWGKAHTRLAVLNAGLIGGLTVSYVLIRGQVTGQVIGGYSNSTEGFVSSMLGPALTINLAHTYLPFDVQLAAWLGTDSVIRFVHLLVAIGLLCLARSLRRARPVSERVEIALKLMLGLWLGIWIYTAFFPQLQLAYFFIVEVEALTPLAWIPPVLVLVLLYLFLGRGGRTRQALGRVKGVFDWFDLDVRPGALPAALLILTTLICCNNYLFRPGILMVFGGLLWAITVTRPLGQGSPEQSRYLQIGLTAGIASVVMLLPAQLANLPTGFANMFRWTYGATVFSVMAAGAFLLYFVSQELWRIRLVAAGLLVIIWALWPVLAVWRCGG